MGESDLDTLVHELLVQRQRRAVDHWHRVGGALRWGGDRRGRNVVRAGRCVRQDLGLEAVQVQRADCTGAILSQRASDVSNADLKGHYMAVRSIL